ncbi:MAG: spore coat associated protein CotJA [Lachnospiraceae bacterium]|nr:spore coat associated protein CotJA [Lachnospiraceae bacterium]
MNCNSTCSAGAFTPGMYGLPQAQAPVMGQSMVLSGTQETASVNRFPVGMGYVPMQQWETPYPMERGFVRGTIFPSLDLPFMVGGCIG